MYAQRSCNFLCKENLFSLCWGVIYHVPNNLRMVCLLGTE
ncbi:hypothetical protein HMPREF0653_01393 [Prevotella disiens JCM 6334 = ATCC 29426]|uniref:Uncharacterized protein n=1 Tax=Prevotella disiens JCM 6334 = ATCC 29426 TaxID=1235811 RepID=A0ABN0NS09_9BACT|nr:hypothetical protein HMPREF0653_01393 [Prevotella disiens JCM 6334 = ATCC 29426]